MATCATIQNEYFLTTQLAKCLCVCVAKFMRLNNNFHLKTKPDVIEDSEWDKLKELEDENNKLIFSDSLNENGEYNYKTYIIMELHR